MTPDSITCPACRKNQEVSTADAICVRCGCEFSALLSIRAASRQFCDQAIEKMRDVQDFDEALRLSEVAWRLTREGTSARVGLLAAVQNGALSEIPKWLQRIRSLEES